MRSHDVLSEPTIKVAKFILDLFYTDITINPDKAMLGRLDYSVIADQMCSGYVGIGMITVFLIWYLATFRSKFRFPAVLLAFPIGVTLIWLSNCLRIALIVAIGSSLSAEIATESFHANAGWIFFIATSVTMVAITRNSRFFNKEIGEDRIAIDSVDALAIPFLIMLAATLISSSLSPEFQWLYPVRAIATGLAILFLWKHIKLQTVSPAVFSIIAGIVVFVLWITLVPSSYEEDRKFSASLFSVSTFLSVGWIIIRLLGSVIVIPIAEELAFRGYLPILFTGSEADRHRAWETQLLPFLISSLLFGALHSSLLAGTLAGAVYYLVKLRSGRLWDAVVAHMTSNLLLSAYVLLSGHWSYW
jgi:exosortase E/protease (VPEID-CTERM system)